MRSDIDGEAAEDRLGSSISLSDDGGVLAIGGGAVSGRARIYRNVSGSWIQIGDDLDGGSISLNSDGNVVAIGTDQVRVFRNVSDEWLSVGKIILMEQEQFHLTPTAI
jgi:hypothetical protein